MRLHCAGLQTFTALRLTIWLAGRTKEDKDERNSNRCGAGGERGGVAAGPAGNPGRAVGNEARKNVPRPPYPRLRGAGVLQLPAGGGAGERGGTAQGGAAPPGKPHSGGGGRHQGGGRRRAGGGQARVFRLCDKGGAESSQHHGDGGGGHGTPGGGGPGGYGAPDQRRPGGAPPGD